ncbi:hypothetical protein Zmor_023659 [Zophobas morio]|uniref:Uncharacterized protein n=1 Tax=Zophobas morio TaxID=2755281 RepID=A0AA38HXA0_9CUCU|nr:hypothetical protein Zmor_023659 [Zophobas morio]
MKSIWGEHLSWPRVEDSLTSKKTKTTVKAPYAVTSEKWKNYYIEKEAAKNKKLTKSASGNRKRKNNRSDPVDESTQKSKKRTKSNTERNDQIAIGDYVLFKYLKHTYPGVIKAHDKYDQYEISAMEQRPENQWKWPSRTDVLWYKKSSIIKKISQPLPSNKSKTLFLIPELNQ